MRSSTSRTRRCWCSGSPAASGTSSRAACRTGCTSRAARRLYPRSLDVAERARSLGALGATISGAGPTVLVWSHYEQTGGVAQALKRETDGWAAVVRVPFEPQGAEVRAL